MDVCLNKNDWQAGYDAGRRREPNQVPEGVEALSWHRGYIEGQAQPTLSELLAKGGPDAYAQDDEDKAWINDKPVGREEI